VEERASEVGEAIVATGSHGMTITTDAGVVTCAEAVMEGTIATNEASKDLLTFDTAVFREHQPKPQCESSLALGEPTVTAGGLPWAQQLTTKGTGKLSGSKKIQITLAFPEATCVMEGAKAKDTFNLVEEENLPLELSVPALALKLAKGSGASCPRTGVLEEPAIAVSDQAQTSEKAEKKNNPRKKNRAPRSPWPAGARPATGGACPDRSASRAGTGRSRPLGDARLIAVRGEQRLPPGRACRGPRASASRAPRRG
jgi:hypothetical protein